MLAAYVVSMARSIERRERLCADLAAMGIPARIWTATDGAALSSEEICAAYDEDANRKGFKRPLSRAEIGCYLSHQRLWAQIASSDAPAALVLEDDAEVSPALPALLENLEQTIPQGAILKLDGCREPKAPTVTFGGHTFACERTIAPRTTGYIIGREAARQMLARKRFFRPIDIDIKHHWEHGVPIFSANPALVRESAQQSTIEASRQGNKQSAFTRFVANLRYQFHFRAGLLRAAAPTADILAASKGVQR